MINLAVRRADACTISTSRCTGLAVNPPRKAFDFYCALALTDTIKSDRRRSDLFRTALGLLFFEDVYGICMIGKLDLNSSVKSNNDSLWTTNVSDYYSKVDTTPSGNDAEFIKLKKLNFINESEIVSSKKKMTVIGIRYVGFDIDSTKRISFREAYP